MKILLIGDFTRPIYAPAFENGFRRLGHNVSTIKYEDYLWENNFLGNYLNRIQNRIHLSSKVLKYNNDILEEAETFCPDFIFLYRCYNIWPSTIKKLKAKGNYIITYNNDDPFSGIPSTSYYRYFQAMLPLADYNYVYRKKNIADYESVNAHNIKILLPYYLEENNYCENCEKDISMGFIGHFENDGRDKLIKALIDNNIPVKVFNGQYWEIAPLYEDIKSVIFPAKRGKEYNHTLNRLKIAIVFLSKINSDTYTRRCFEIPATKTLMLSEYTDDLNRMFPDGECAVYFRNEKELIEKCNYLLDNPTEIERISLNGYKRLCELGGSEIDRCKEIINDFSSQH